MYHAAPELVFRPAAAADLDRVAALEVGRTASHQRSLPPWNLCTRRLWCSLLTLPEPCPTPSAALAQAASYPADEAASRERLDFRIRNGAAGGRVPAILLHGKSTAEGRGPCSPAPSRSTLARARSLAHTSSVPAASLVTGLVLLSFIH